MTKTSNYNITKKLKEDVVKIFSKIKNEKFNFNIYNIIELIWFGDL